MTSAIGRRACKIVLDALAIGGMLALAGLGLGPRTGRYRTMTVLSGSMRPGMPEGSVVVLVPEPARRVRRGQVIAYNVPVDDHHVVAHRIVEVITPGPQPVIRTKGDANPTPDPWTATLTS